MYKIAVCDDVPEEREALRGFAGEYFTRECLEYSISVFSDGQALLNALLAGQRFDIYLLDILMPGLDGMELAKILRGWEETGVIVFITSTADYAVKGYSVNALDYIVKPTSCASMDAVLSRIIKRLNQNGTLVINIQNQNGAYELPISGIVHVESKGHNLMFYMLDGTVERIYASMMDYSETLTKYSFFARCHKSYIINLNHVKKVMKNIVVMKDGKELNISRRYTDSFKQKYQKHIFGKTKMFIS